MTKIFAIHGAFSTPTIFNYLRLRMNNWEWQLFDYSEEINDFEQVCDDAMKKVDEPCHIIGHSMGGIVALYLATHPKVKTVTTIASPVNGLEVNMMQTYMSRSSFIRELQRGSSFIRKLHNQKYKIPVQHIITTKGFNPYMNDDNDGVVALKSQRGWSIGTTHEIAANHAEIMQHEDCVKLIKDFIDTNG